jgi:hypothetical protein
MTSIPDSVAQLASRLEPDGWIVHFAARGERFPDNRVITLSHALTSEHHFVARPGDDLDAIVASILSDAEISRIASRPDDIQQSVLLGRLRTIGQRWKWEPNALGDIGSVLRSVGVLSESEEDWLQSAGAAWSDPH